MDEKKLKRLVIEVTEEQHKEIKISAAVRNLTMARYIRQAIDEMILREKQYNA